MRCVAIEFSFRSIALLIVLLLPLPCAALELTQGAMLSNPCAACHGPDGHSPGDIPSIAGKSAEFIENALKEFRDDKRPSTVMNRHAKGYSDEQIRLISGFFASRK